MRTRPWLLALMLAIGAVACGKDESATEAAPAADSAAPAAAAADDSAPPAATAAAPADASAATAPEEDPAVAEKRAAIAFALAEQQIAADPLGQWATAATASSSYNDAKDQASYAAWQATGAPNVERYGDDGNSWASHAADGGIEWLQVEFATPVHAAELRVRQNHAPGAIIRLDWIDEAGAAHPLWEGLDETAYAGNQITWFTRSAEPTPFLVKGAKITLATNAVSGWNEIDAVQLVAAPSAGAPAAAPAGPGQ